jgi:hypothetical protein
MFNKNGYEIRKNVLSKDTLSIAYEYYKMKVDNDEATLDMSQVLGTFTMYGDTLGDSILKWSLPLAEEVVGEELYPCYTFMRVYNNSDILDPHCDRPSCEFSATIPIYFDQKWPIHLQKHNFEKHGNDFSTPLRTEPSKSLILDMGDICFYEGTKMNHWRMAFGGTECVQLFIHYVRKNGEYSEYKFDHRKKLGLPKSEKELLSNHTDRMNSYFDD